ncbi:MAG: hypothetical protein Q9205_006932, partial [Flavoplaca limonia]
TDCAKPLTVTILSTHIQALGSGSVIVNNTPVKSIVATAMTDVSNSHSSTYHPRRLEWPVVDDKRFHDLANRALREATYDAKTLAEGLIDAELAKCGGLDDGLHEDRGITDELASSHVMKRPRKQVALLHALY